MKRFCEWLLVRRMWKKFLRLGGYPRGTQWIPFTMNRYEDQRIEIVATIKSGRQYLLHFESESEAMQHAALLPGYGWTVKYEKGGWIVYRDL